MKILNTILLFVFASFSLYANDKQKFTENRFSFSAGLGVSHSIYNKSLSKQEIIPSLREQKKSIGFNFFGEMNFHMKRNFYMSVGVDYNQFNSIKYRLEDGFNNEFARLNYMGKISDQYTSLQITANKKFPFKNHSLHIGTGVLFSIVKNPYITISGGIDEFQYIMEVSERKSSEFGIPLQLSYEYSINQRWSIGLKSQFQYLLSVNSAEHIYFSPYFRINIGK